MTEQDIIRIIDQEFQKRSISSLNVPRHTHNGTDSDKLLGRNLVAAPREALTTVNSSSFTTGGSTDLKTADATILDNMRTRINEMYAALQTLGLIK